MDANCIAQFQMERVKQGSGIGVSAIEHILSQTQIVLDDKKLCEQEWLQCIQGPPAENLKDWMADQMAAGGIRLVVCHTHPNHCRELRKLGFPSTDIKWARLVCSAGASAMVTDDIDFYDPRCKKSKSAVKEKTKNNQSGPVAKYFRTHMNSKVMRLKHVVSQIS